jgi:hypothetical protein
MWPGLAEDEARELTLLARVLKWAGEDLTSISNGMRVRGGLRIEMMGSALDRMGRRWQHRVAKARRDAIADHGGDEDWEAAHSRRANDDLAEHLMARGINALMDARRTSMRRRSLGFRSTACCFRRSTSKSMTVTPGDAPEPMRRRTRIPSRVSLTERRSGAAGSRPSRSRRQ